MKRLNNLYAKIIARGTSEENEKSLNKRIQILNTYALIWIHLVVFFVITDFLLPKGVQQDGDMHVSLSNTTIYSVSTQLSTGLFQIVILYLNHKKQFKVARVFFLLVAFANFSFFTVFIDPGKYIEYYFVFMSGLALPIFKKNTVPFIVMLLSFLLFITPYYFYVVYPQDYIDRLLLPPTFGIFLCIYLLVNYFKKLNQSNEHLLEIEKDRVLSDKMILEQQEAELRELSEFKSHFFVNLSHEIRTPLTLIQGYTSQINLDRLEVDDRQKIAVITEQTDQMQSIVNSIMDLSKMDSNEFTIHEKPCSLEDVLLHSYTTFKPLFDKKEIEFALQNNNENLSINIDKELFDKVLSNLLSNALKFTSTKGIVVLKAIFIDENLSIEVIDNGIGIPEKEIDLVFKRFYQVKNHITQSQGSGIGLAFTKSIVQAHKFKMLLESKQKVMTKFSIQIPASAIGTTQGLQKSIDTGLNTNKVKLIKAKKTKKTKSKILVVDDHEQMRRYLCSVLVNYEITEAEHGQHALEILQKENFDLILTDFMMPVMDGETFVNILKKQKNKMPILVLTARTDQKAKLNMLRLGVDGYLHKPFLEEELLLQVTNAIRLYNNIKEINAEISVDEKKHLDSQAKKFQDQLMNYISENLTSSLLSVEDLAVYLGISKSTLNRKTKVILGQTVNEVILEARLSKARELKRENPLMNKKQVADRVGFSNVSYLFKKLEERYGKI